MVLSVAIAIPVQADGVEHTIAPERYEPIPIEVHADRLMEQGDRQQPQPERGAARPVLPGADAGLDHAAHHEVMKRTDQVEVHGAGPMMMVDECDDVEDSLIPGRLADHAQGGGQVLVAGLGDPILVLNRLTDLEDRGLLAGRERDLIRGRRELVAAQALAYPEHAHQAGAHLVQGLDPPGVVRQKPRQELAQGQAGAGRLVVHIVGTGGVRVEDFGACHGVCGSVWAAIAANMAASSARVAGGCIPAAPIRVL